MGRQYVRASAGMRQAQRRINVRRHTVPVVSWCYGDSIMTTDKNRRSQDLRSVIQRWTRTQSPLLAGIITGFAGLAVSFGLKGANLGRPIGDPVPLMLSVTQVTDGFTYFPWRPALYHLVFAVLLGVLAVVTLVILGKGNVTRTGAIRAARIAALMNVLFVAVLRVDAIVVGFWYLVSGLASVLISGLVAGLAASWLAKRQEDSRS